MGVQLQMDITMAAHKYHRHRLHSAAIVKVLKVIYMANVD